jgi:mitotic spindle assembly checkpoint protein MAD2
MSKTSQATKNTITLRGSAQIVTEFFGYSINSILYQRGIYDPDTFTKVNKYGLGMQVTTDVELQNYMKKVLAQLEDWLEKGHVKRLVLVITGTEKQEVLERWVFDVDTDEKTVATGGTSSKNEKDIMKEISAIIRQITSSVSFLPLLDQPCTFDLLVYTPNDTNVPELWEESDPKYITKSNEVRLRSFTTKIHKVETSVAYRADD